MNYGKRKAAEKQRQITSKSSMQSKRLGVRLFKALLLCIIVVGVAGVIGGGLFFKKIVDDAPEVTPADVKPSEYTTFVYADDGETELQRLVTSGSNRVYKSIDEIPIDLQHAFVAIEDERFYEHNGIDIQGIARAGVVGLTSGSFSEGASTITQQLIKNNVFPDFVNEETIFDKAERKIQEWVLALQIEQQMSKSEILEAYMNTINLGQNCLGVQAASKRYFNKDVSELTLSECAVIAGITQKPTGYNPITNPEANAQRRAKVLKNMLEQGYIDQAAYDEAMADDVYDRIQSVNNETESSSTVYSYFIDALAEQVLKDLQEQLGYTENQAYNALYGGGLSIYSTQNVAMQEIADEEMNKDSNYPGTILWGLDYALTITRKDGSIDNYSSGHIKQYVKKTYNNDQGLLYRSKDAAREMVDEWMKTVKKKSDISYDEVFNLTPQPQASCTIIDQYTGQIKAMVGGRGEKLSSLGLNRAYTGSKRQPGSTFKILAAYAPALDTGAVTLGSTIDDKNYEISGGKVISGHRGRVTVRTAIASSLNSCAVQVSDQIGQELGFEYCEKFGISTLVRSRETDGGIYTDLTQTLALGGLTDGVYNYELCAAYAAIANNGQYIEPTLYTKILDHDGNLLLENSGATRTVIKQGTAAVLIDALKSVVSSGTGTACNLSNMTTAGKTGTTTSNKDLWFVGFTPYYTCAVWGGYDDNEECNSDTTFRFRLWKGIMSRIHEGLENKDFDTVELVKKTVCSVSGLLPTSGCPTSTEVLAIDEVPTTRCTGNHPGYYSSGSSSSNNTTEEAVEEEAPDVEITPEETGGDTKKKSSDSTDSNKSDSGKKSDSNGGGGGTDSNTSNGDGNTGDGSGNTGGNGDGNTGDGSGNTGTTESETGTGENSGEGGDVGDNGG